MTRKTRIITAWVAVIVGVGLFSGTLVHALWYAPDGSNYMLTNKGAVPEQPIANVPKEDPVRLEIPALNINAHVQYVGVNPKGALGVPNNFTDVAWYRSGTVPGQMGSAIIDGHVDNGLGLAGVFKHLGDIKPGDDVYVTTKGGAKLHFVVSKIESYPYQAVPMGQIFAQNDAQRLDLITCGGTWVNGGDTYDHRLVVYTKLVGVAG